MSVPYQAPPPLPAENGVHVWRTAVIMPIITFIFVALRFYSRRLRGGFSLDDYLTGFTMVVIIVHAILMAYSTYNGMGLHIWQFNEALNERYYLWIGISSEFYALGLMCAKNVLLVVYLQLFGHNKKMRIAIYLTMFFVCGYITANMLTEFLGCNPIERKWKWNIPATCINNVAANIAYGAGHIISDLVIAILPIIGVWRMSFTTTSQKLGLSIAFCSGFIAWSIACIRWAIGTYNMLSYDRPWWAGISFAFSILEVNTCLICGCVVTFSPLLSTAPRKDSHASNWSFDAGSPEKRRKSSAAEQLDKGMEGQAFENVPPPQMGYSAAPIFAREPQGNILLSLNADRPRFTADTRNMDGTHGATFSGDVGSADTLVRQESYESAGDYNNTSGYHNNYYQNEAYQGTGLAQSYYGETPFPVTHPTVPQPVAFTSYGSAQAGSYQYGAPIPAWAQSSQHAESSYYPEFVSPAQVAPTSYSHPQQDPTPSNQHQPFTHQAVAPHPNTQTYDYVYTPGQPPRSVNNFETLSRSINSDNPQYASPDNHNMPITDARYSADTSGDAPVGSVSPSTPYNASCTSSPAAYGTPQAVATYNDQPLSAVPETDSNYGISPQEATASPASGYIATAQTMSFQALKSSTAPKIKAVSRKSLPQTPLETTAPPRPATSSDTESQEALRRTADSSPSTATEPYSCVSSNFTNFADDDAPFDLSGLQALSEAQGQRHF